MSRWLIILLLIILRLVLLLWRRYTGLLRRHRLLLLLLLRPEVLRVRGLGLLKLRLRSSILLLCEVLLLPEHRSWRRRRLLLPWHRSCAERIARLLNCWSLNLRLHRPRVRLLRHWWWRLLRLRDPRVARLEGLRLRGPKEWVTCLLTLNCREWLGLRIYRICCKGLIWLLLRLPRICHRLGLLPRRLKGIALVLL